MRMGNPGVLQDERGERLFYGGTASIQGVVEGPVEKKPGEEVWDEEEWGPEDESEKGKVVAKEVQVEVRATVSRSFLFGEGGGRRRRKREEEKDSRSRVDGFREQSSTLTFLIFSFCLSFVQWDTPVRNWADPDLPFERKRRR